ncbi:hypothetical protein T265_01059 [Opisthorchis viverrini]|uniref:Uncharacterized protein n=1 Tax=Opisthorchis viverrini TaxID=6198 RepID=A0A074ZZS6_OPIVI|nr:hypothetical protein T265_01059 [Opisthorchis viverrini]KER32968.1 hypothetical protein T265_01059 [Opisthorchis viverrini]
MTRFNSLSVTVTQRMADADKYDEQPLCAQLITKNIDVWAIGAMLGKCSLHQKNNGHPIYDVRLNSKVIPEGYQGKANLFGWYVNTQVLPDGNCDTTIDVPGRPHLSNKALVFLTGPEDNNICHKLREATLGGVRIVNCYQIKTEIVEVQKLGTYHIETEKGVDYSTVQLLAEKANEGQTGCAYNAFPAAKL